MKTSLDLRSGRYVLRVENIKHGHTAEFRVTKHGPSIVSEGLETTLLLRLIEGFELFVGGYECAAERLEDLAELAGRSHQFETLGDKLDLSLIAKQRR